MRTITNRPYIDATDRQSIIDLITTRPVERAADFPTIVDVHELMDKAEVAANTQVWQANDGHVVGYASIDPSYASVWDMWFMRFEAATALAGGEVEAAMLAWGLHRLQEANLGREKVLKLKINCREDNAARLTLLRAHGFVAQPEYTVAMERSLSDPLPTAQLPPGFTIRHVIGEEEAEVLAALHRAAFGTEFMTTEGRLAWMRTPSYDPRLDLVVETTAGRLAAYCFCMISPEDNALAGRMQGQTDPIGVHPDYQRQGLARALLLTGCRLLRERSMAYATLSTGSWNQAMQAAARSAGYGVVSTTIFFERGPD